MGPLALPLVLVAQTTAALSAPARPEPWRPSVRLAWANDQFAPFAPRTYDLVLVGGDDDGFTNDLELGAALSRGPHRLRLELRHRMITSRTSLDRWDEGTAALGYARVLDRRELRLTLGSRVGLALGGDLGGAALQDWFHATTGFGRTLDGNEWGHLQDHYPGDTVAAALVGVRGEAERPLVAALSASAGADLQAALGQTGLQWVRLFAGLGWNRHARRLAAKASVGLELARLASPDANLAMPGGYDLGRWFLTPRFRLALTGRRFELGWEVRLDEGGSRASTGVLYVIVGESPD